MKIQFVADATIDSVVRSANAAEKRRKQRVRGIAVLGLTLLFGSLTLRASADTAIFFYTTSGVENVSAYYSFQQHVLYTSDGVVAGYVSDSGYVYGLSNELLGYVNAGPQGGVP